LVTLEGACVVYVNGEKQLHFMEVPVPVHTNIQITPVVDVFATTASVRLLECPPLGTLPPYLRSAAAESECIWLENEPAAQPCPRIPQRQNCLKIHEQEIGFHTLLKGHHCILLDNKTVTVCAQECKQCIALADRPLKFHSGVGWYFELCIMEIADTSAGGFGLGVTLARVNSMDSLPDRAWRLPETWLTGYWGRFFASGQQHVVAWSSQELKPQDRVGFLVTPKGACVIYVNGEKQMHFSDTPLPVFKDVELVPVVDIFASAATLRLLQSQPPGSAEHGQNFVEKEVVQLASSSSAAQYH